MPNRILNITSLEQVLQSHWADFLDVAQIMHFILDNISNTSFPVLKQDEMPKKQTKLTMSRIIIKDEHMESWIECTVPKNNGIVIGTVICCFTLTGEFWIVQSYGTEFQPKT